MNGPDDRALVKQPAMTFGYDSTLDGTVGQIVKELKNRKLPFKHKMEEVRSLARAARREVKILMPYATRLRDYLKKCAAECAEHNKLLRWHTPDGMPILNCYYDEKVKKHYDPASEGEEEADEVDSRKYR
jgi:hypothetical protein